MHWPKHAKMLGPEKWPIEEYKADEPLTELHNDGLDFTTMASVAIGDTHWIGRAAAVPLGREGIRNLDESAADRCDVRPA
jgi:hypothetical protein